MTNIPWKQHFKTIIRRFLGIFNPDFFSYNQVDWGVIWYVHKYQIKLKNQKFLVHACATIWEASAVFKRCLTVSPDDQEFLFFHVIGIIVASSSCWEGRGKNDRALCRRWYFFFPLFSLSSPWNSHGAFKSSKVSSYLLRFQLWFIFF